MDEQKDLVLGIVLCRSRGFYEAQQLMPHGSAQSCRDNRQCFRLLDTPVGVSNGASEAKRREVVQKF